MSNLYHSIPNELSQAMTIHHQSMEAGQGRRTDFSGADLHDTDLRGMNLQYADFRGANLRGVNFEGAKLRFCILTDADMRDTEMSHLHLGRTDLQGANFANAILRNVDFKGAYLRECDFSGADLLFAVFDEASIIGAKFDGALLPTGESWETYCAEVVPALCTAGGESLELVAEKWGCHGWQYQGWPHSPMAVAFGVKSFQDIPALYGPRVRQFLQFFDARLLPNPYLQRQDSTGHLVAH